MSSRSFGVDGGCRLLSVSKDGGARWSDHRPARDLPTPPCMSSVVRARWPEGDKAGLLLHSLPRGRARSNGTVMISTDEGKNWQVGRVIEPGRFAYSCMVMLPGGDVGCLYETNDGKIVFARFALDWLHADR